MARISHWGIHDRGIGNESTPMDSTTYLPSPLDGIPVRLPLLLRLGCRADADSLQGGGA